MNTPQPPVDDTGAIDAAVAALHAYLGPWLSAEVHGTPLGSQIRMAATLAIRDAKPHLDAFPAAARPPVPPQAITAAELDACIHCGGTGREPGLIPLPGLEPARLRSRRRDGEIVWQFRCPECHHWGDTDDDQLHGRVSLDHTNCEHKEGDRKPCTFHQTHNLFAMAFPEAR